jgi:8-oxo-dGTP diphosphatase
MSYIQQYVVGFVFSPDHTKVLLIQKNRPAWQRNHYNGIGGKIEEGEEPIEAMVRECNEESGLYIQPMNWKHFAVIVSEERMYRVHCFSTVSAIYEDFENKTDEEIAIIDVTALWSTPVIPNLRWLIPFALDHDIAGPTIFHDIGEN